MSVRPATKDDVDAIAAIHKAQFPDQFMARVSTRLLGRFYEAHLARAIVLVHDANDQVDGFLLGGTVDDLSASRKAFVGRHGWRLLGEMLLSPRMVRMATHRTGLLLLRRGVHNTPPIEGCLRSLAVADAAKGRGTAGELVDGFEARLGKRHSHYFAWVEKSNQRAFRFYEKAGFDILTEDNDGMILEKHIAQHNANDVAN